MAFKTAMQPNMNFSTILNDKSKAKFGVHLQNIYENSAGGEKKEFFHFHKARTSEYNPRGNVQETNQQNEMPGFAYEMNDGFVMVIHNTCFPKRQVDRVWRKGDEHDVKELRKFFEYDRGFKFRELEDLTADEMFNVAKNLAEMDYTKYDCFFLFVLTHGDQTGMLGVDENPIAIDAITGLFTAEKCPTLANKPKFFIIQACRGKKDDPGALVTDASMFIPPKHHVVPIESDFLVAFSSPPGYASFRDEENGSWFIQTLVKVLKDYCEKEHLMDMLLRVNFLIAKVLSNNNLKQMPLQECRLTKKCYFSTIEN